MNKTKCFSFGISREAYDKVYIPSRKASIDTSIPGPGTYTLLSTVGREARKFSLNGRTPYHQGIIPMLKTVLNYLDEVKLTVKRNVPGPGAYDPKLGIDKMGVYHLSNLS